MTWGRLRNLVVSSVALALIVHVVMDARTVESWPEFGAYWWMRTGKAFYGLLLGKLSWAILREVTRKKNIG